jgi:ribosome-binding factor A
MSQRIAKTESLIQQVVATALIELMEKDAAVVTVTRVDAAPDMRSAIVWIGLLGTPDQQDKLWENLERKRGMLQASVAAAMTSKFVPRINMKRDTGGEYAAHIERLLRGM